MKLSEKLEHEALQEENDLKAWALHTRSKKEAVREYFVEVELPELRQNDMVSGITNPSEYLFKIVLVDGRVFDLYPKKNRLFDISTKKWHSNGLDKLKKILNPK